MNIKHSEVVFASAEVEMWLYLSLRIIYNPRWTMTVKLNM